MIDTSTIPDNVIITPTNMDEMIVDGGYYYISFTKNSKKAYLSSDGILVRKNGKLKPYTVVKIVMSSVREPAIPELWRLKKVDDRWALINANTNGVLTYDAGLVAEMEAGKLDTETYQPFYLVDDTGKYTSAQLFDLDSTSIPESVYAVNTYESDVNEGYRIDTRVYSISVNVSAKYKHSTVCLPCGARLPDEMRSKFKLWKLKHINGKNYSIGLHDKGIPRNTGVHIVYQLKTPGTGDVTLKLLIDDSVGDQFCDDLLLKTCAARDGFVPKTAYAIGVDNKSDTAVWLLNGMTYLIANTAFYPLYYAGKEIKTRKVVYDFHNSQYPSIGGLVSNTLLRCAGCVIPVEYLIEKASNTDEKLKIVNDAVWHVGRAHDNQSFLTSLAGQKKKDGTDGDLITELKSMAK